MKPEILKEAQIYVKEWSQTAFPTVPKIVYDIDVFCWNIRDYYEKFLAILPKLELDGIEGFIVLITDIANIISSKSDSLVASIGDEILKKMIEERDKDPFMPSIIKRSLMSFSFEEIAPHVSGIYKEAYTEYNIKIQALDEKMNALSEEEQNICEYFFLFIAKLWFRRIIMDVSFSHPLTKIFYRDYIVQLYINMNTFYDKEIISQRFIERIQNIKIPNEEKLLAEYGINAKGEKIVMVSANESNNHPLKSNSYSLKQIAIAYAVMNIVITKQNADSILKKHSKLKSSSKLIQKRINKISELTLLSENKTVDSKHLTDLIAAERLISGTKNKKAKADVKRIITAFKTTYDTKY
jgi:hypothetical protein